MAGRAVTAPGQVRIASFAAPGLDGAMVARPRLLDLVDRHAQVLVITAPSGFGKTVLAQQILDTGTTPSAWVPVDVLDDDRVSIWWAIIKALRSLCPDIDDEAELALLEGPRSKRFLAILLERLASRARDGVVVLDALPADSPVLDGLASLIERCGPGMRWIITAHQMPALPLSRWRALGLVSEITDDELRFDDQEADALAATIDSSVAGSHVASLNEVVGGWPLALHLGLVAVDRSGDPLGALRSIEVRAPELLDDLLDQVLAALPADLSTAAAALAIGEVVHPDLAQALLGDTAGRVIAELRRRRLLRPGSASRADTVELHPLLRALLQRRLRWEDPARFDELHRRAADLARGRTEFHVAYRHLMAVGDAAAANALVMEPALAMANSGDRRGVMQLIESMPPPVEIDDAGFALDLAHAAFFAGSAFDAQAWCARAQAIGALDGGSIELRYHSARALLALMDGHLTAAQRHVDAFVELRQVAVSTGPVEQRFPTIAARLALIGRDLESARAWVDRARVMDQPDVVRAVNVAGLESWLDTRTGRLSSALERLSRVLEVIDQRSMRPHHGAFDAIVSSAWARFGSGDLAGAAELSDAAREDAAALGSDWHRVRAGLVSAKVRSIMHGPAAALAQIRDVRISLTHPASDLARHLDVIEAQALVHVGRTALAVDVAASAADTPRLRLVLASAALAEGRLDDLEVHLAADATWPLPDRLEAMVLRAAAQPGRLGVPMMLAALDEAALSGWVSPFLGHGGRVDDILLGLRPERLPAALTAALRVRNPGSAPARGKVEALTARERTILQLLPTHLSYVEIGERLFVSVNTVKSNLKSIYRKLNVSNRSEAVETAQSVGLL